MDKMKYNPLTGLMDYIGEGGSGDLSALQLAVRELQDTKQDKTAIVTATDAVSVDKRSVIDVTGDVVISLVPYEQDGYAHYYEIVLNVGDTAYSVAFPDSVKWVRGLKIVPNARYNIIIIEDNTAMWVAVTK